MRFIALPPPTAWAFYTFFALFFAAASPFAADSKPLTLAYGANRIDINADGIPDLIIRTRWDVLSPHNADKYAILTHSGSQGSDIFYEVGTEDDPNQSFYTSEGADCVLSAYKFSLDANGMLRIVTYQRDLGDGYADSRPVTISTYTLKNRAHATLGGMGLTPFYLAKTRQTTTRETYCDVRVLMTQ